MTAFMLDTDTASRLMRADRTTVTAMRRSGASDVSISAVTLAELLFGSRLRPEKPALMSAVRAFVARVTVHAWDDAAAEHHADLRAAVRAAGRSAGAYDFMIAAHARALGATLVTSDKAISGLGVSGLSLADWAGGRESR